MASAQSTIVMGRSTVAARTQSAKAQTKASAVMAPAMSKASKKTSFKNSFVQGAQSISTERKVSITAQRTMVAPVASDVAVAGTAPHGGKLVDLMDAAKGAELAAKVTKTIDMSDRNACDVELLCVGGFSPLTGFLGEEDYNSVVADMKLKDGLIYGLPIVMDTDDESIAAGDVVELKYQGKVMAYMTVEEKWTPDKAVEAKGCYGVTTIEHPGVKMIAEERGQYYISGPVTGVSIPERPFPCATPAEVRAELPAGKDVVAFQCRNPVHRAHYELFTRALGAENVGEGAVCLVHPTCGPTQADDIPGPVRYKTYEVLKEETANPQTRWAYLPYAMHMAGPREAIQHMIIRKNYGCTHFIIGRDMAGSKSSIDGEDFYGAYDAQDLANASSEELGVKTVPSLNLCYTEEEGYVTVDVADAKNLTKKSLSGTKFRKALRAGEDIPEWFAFKSVVKVLRENA